MVASLVDHSVFIKKKKKAAWPPLRQRVARDTPGRNDAARLWLDRNLCVAINVRRLLHAHFEIF